MANIVIKKRVSLAYLGEEYSQDYLIFSAIPVKEFEQLIDKTPDDSVAATKYICELLADRFIEGKFQGQTVEAKDIDSFDGETVADCFALLTGQKIDPKV